MSQTGDMGPNPASPSGFLSSEEIAEAFDALSTADQLKLGEIERVHLRGTDLSPGDLLHEAVCSAILGDRNCPRSVSFMAFIIQTMRSIANHQREKRWREAADGGVSQEAGGAGIMFSGDPTNPEQFLFDQESNDTVNAIHGSFDGDEQAQVLILGWSEGYRGKELREFIGLDQAALDYLIKRVRRTMMKHNPNGWKNR
jgi:DNA-directed RNA polymerase specialized sigma24 family protein